MIENPLTLASDIVDKARRLGADEVDAYVVQSTESSVQVRHGVTERVIVAGSQAVAYQRGGDLPDLCTELGVAHPPTAVDHGLVVTKVLLCVPDRGANGVDHDDVGHLSPNQVLARLGYSRREAT